MSAKSRYLLDSTMPTGSNLWDCGVLAGRGAIQTSLGEATGLRGLAFLGMLITTLQISTHPHACAFQSVKMLHPLWKIAKIFPILNRPKLSPQITLMNAVGKRSKTLPGIKTDDMDWNLKITRGADQRVKPFPCPWDGPGFPNTRRQLSRHLQMCIPGPIE